jgi:hypothetical protein
LRYLVFTRYRFFTYQWLVGLLKNVRIAEMNIHDEGRIISIKFDMPYYAESPPNKWVELGNNTVPLELIYRLYKKLI